MYTHTLRSSCLFLLLVLPSEGTAQDLPAKHPITSTARSENKRYAMDIAQSSETWKVGTLSQSSTKIAQAIAGSLAKKLSAKGLTRTQPLDGQCCTLQLALIKVDSDDDPAAGNRTLIVARIVLLDVDKQQVYSKEYRGQAKTHNKNASTELQAAVDDVVIGMTDDPGLLKALQGN